jgi:hypothetical protein
MKTKGLFLIALILIPISVHFAVILPTRAANGAADVYILELNNVPAEADGVVINQTLVQMGAINACLPNTNDIHSNIPHAHPQANDYVPYYQVTPEIVTTWTEYEQIVLSSVGKIIVNTHGDYLPVPSGYSKTAWVDAIAEAMATRRLSWVHCGGYTFLHVFDENGTNEGSWTETVNEGVLGAGFDRLMSHIGIQNANITTPPDGGFIGNMVAIDTQQEPALDWGGDWNGIEEYVENPLNQTQFLARTNLTIFLPFPSNNGQVYLPAGVVSFAETNIRNASSQGAGVYVHLGVWRTGYDYWNGYIGTIGALLPECWTFEGQMDAKQVDYGRSALNATIGVQPVITGRESSATDVSFDMVFPIYGATQDDRQQFPQDNFNWYSNWFVVEPHNDDWSDIWTQAYVIQSGGSGGGGLNGMANGLIGGTMWFMGMPGLLTEMGGTYGAIASGILWGVGGLLLLAQWASQGYDNNQGVSQRDHRSAFHFIPGQTEIVNNGLYYCEFETFVGVHVSIPIAHTPARTGWQVFPLDYYISGLPNWPANIPPGWGLPPNCIVENTLQIAVYFGNGGQSDAGSGHDTGHYYNDPNVVQVIPGTSFHGYLQGCLPDNEDWYSFTSNDSNKKAVYVDMTPPNFVNFDLQLYNSSGYPNGLVSTSNTNISGQTQYVETYSNLTGPWYIRIYPGSDPNAVSPSGVYSCAVDGLTGDVNQDGIVNILDAIQVSNAFLSTPGGTKWNANADLNGDGVVNILDAIILSNNYGKTANAAQGQGAPMGKPAGGAHPMNGGGTTAAVNPTQITVFKGETFSINVTVNSVMNLQGWEVKLYWNSTVLNCTNAAVVTPSIWQGNTQDYGAGLQPNYNSTCARFWKAETANYPAPPFNGSTTITTLTFQALQPGTTSLVLTDTILGDNNAQPINCTVSSGSVIVYWGRYLRSDTQTVNGLNAYKLNIPESASSASNVQSGLDAPPSWGIRVWVRHSNGTETEVALDGQTGTPEAVVTGSGMRSATTAASQMSMQSTDSLVVRVYFGVDGGWSPIATFTTEQLQASTLQTAIWTVYYNTSASFNRISQTWTSTLYWGTTTYNSRIQNLQYA